MVGRGVGVRFLRLGEADLERSFGALDFAASLVLFLLLDDDDDELELLDRELPLDDELLPLPEELLLADEERELLPDELSEELLPLLDEPFLAFFLPLSLPRSFLLLSPPPPPPFLAAAPAFLVPLRLRLVLRLRAISTFPLVLLLLIS